MGSSACPRPAGLCGSWANPPAHGQGSCGGGGPALAVLKVPLTLSYRKRKERDTAIFCCFLPIGGALQLVFCLQRAFVSSSKQALSYC